MSLIKCVECGNEVSENARNCPFCGNPMKSTINEKFKNKTVYILIMYLVGGGVNSNCTIFDVFYNNHDKPNRW